MNLKIKKTLKNLDFLLNKRVFEKNKYFLLFYKNNTQRILLKTKDIYFYTRNKYPLILIKFNSLIKLLNFIKIKNKYVVLINVCNLIYKKHSYLIKYLFMTNLFIFLVQKNLILFKLKQLNLRNLSFFKNFNFI